MSEILLRVENIVKEFPGVKVLKGVSFELKKGEVLALVGENGAGKSTLMKILSGAYTKDSGKIYFEGEEVEINSPKKAQHLGISIIHQELNLCPHLSVAANIFLGREFSNKTILDEKRQNEEAKKILDLLGMDINPTEKVRNLTVSKQQMVEIAKAISANAKLLIMDEPTSSLSEKEIDELFRVIRDLKNKGTSIIYISHRLEELKKIVDTVAVMRDGEMVATFQYKDVTLDEIIRLMVGRKLEEKYPRITVERGEKILEVRNLTRKNVLKDISFELYKGEILGIAGLVGSGRTELARAIFGADRVDYGEILLHGRKVKINSPADAIESGIVYIPEDRKFSGLALGLSVISNIMMASVDKVCNPLGVINRARELEIGNKTVKDLRIKTPSLWQKVKNLSGGNQQKVIIGRWLVKQPRIFIFDEPTRGIDVGTKIEIYNILNRLKQKGIGIIVISSELPEILGVSDRILVMCEGRLKAELEAGKTNQEEIMYYATLYDEGRRIANA
ncbi:sugar ABC transporter ATP-binding protein [Thermosediminibacter litoriperuensis]|uniref:Monosaccharide ABC transporter ATP-binding protein, CUT2 family (TC 3.A.1.2.-) n=1 Tax=Thermosediminibacter litoriperuensis TaxID=291989 RepID=A0A5S5AFI9_9FIRM|nr:sugar ABC transporter ATP-binding protein [Thermosediminibacter litoriperuensis]TYP48727.1 monosaccharide ABC transporter ATP-binding protein, CUT2 family (TC 3.A.1.2.-) [Thermosediminibacter litoriperuensis]